MANENNETANLVRFNGYIDSIIFVGDNGFAILSVCPLDDVLGMKTVTVAGTLFEPRKKDKVEIEGEWSTHPKFGLQIKASRIQVLMPETNEGVYRLLKSKTFLPGVGAKTAKVLTETFGTKIFEVLEKEPARLLEVKGISKKKLEKIVAAYQEKVDMRNILQFCAIYDIPQSQGAKIYEVYGGSAVTILLRNPYLLTESNRGIKGIGFKKADSMAMKRNIPKDSEDRITHGLLFEVNELTAKKGSTAVSKETLLRESATMMELEPEVVEPYMETMLTAGNIIREDELDGKPYVWNAHVYDREQHVASKIMQLRDTRRKVRIPYDITHAIDVAETKNHITLADSQREALITTLKNKVSILTGGPGTGKTTTTRCLIDVLEAEGNEVVCAAPTGRASKRMKEATGHQAGTIHRLLEYDPETGGFKRNEEKPLEGDVFLIDESSMIDNYLMSCLVDALPVGAMVVFIGDVDQLPSVGAGKVLEDMIASKAVAVSRLKTIFRQASTSKIITAAHDVNSGHMPEITNNPNDDFFFMESSDYVKCSNTILKLIDYIPKKFGCDPLWDVQVLSPKKGSEVGTDRLNMMIQEQCNPDVKRYRAQIMAQRKQKQNIPLTGEDKAALTARIKTPMIMGRECIFAEGDKVMQIVNDYNKMVFNGEVGIIQQVFPSAKNDEICIVIKYPDDEKAGEFKPVGYTRDELFKEVSLSYACTIHKSQGSEYKYVIIPVMPTFSIMLQRKLIYTGITRGKTMVVMVGSKESFGHAISNHFRAAVGTRHTKLKYWLQHPFELAMAA